MLGAIDAFDFELALDLGKTLGEIRDLPNQEIVAWRAYYRVRNELQKLHAGR
jgi:hypothetical protein